MLLRVGGPTRASPLVGRYCRTRLALASMTLGALLVSGASHAEETGSWLVAPPPVPDSVVEGRTVTGHITFDAPGGAPLGVAELAELGVAQPELEFTPPLREPVKWTREGTGWRFEWQAPPVPAGAGALEIEATLSLAWGGGTTTPTTKSIRVSPDVCVRAKDLTFGDGDDEVIGGCKATAHCTAVDFSGSRNLRPGGVLRFEYLGGDPGVTIWVWRSGDPGAKELGNSEGAYLDVQDVGCRAIQLCFRPQQLCPHESLEPEELRALIAIKPAGLADADQRAARVELQATVQPSSFWSCYASYILLTMGLLLTWYLWRGFVIPHGFVPGSTVRVHPKATKLARSPDAQLSGVPHGQRGWYRNATCCFDAGGTLVRRGKGILQLEAGPGGIIRIATASCQLRRKIRGKWEVVDPTGEVPDTEHEANLEAGAVYSVNDMFYFRVDA